MRAYATILSAMMLASVAIVGPTIDARQAPVAPSVAVPSIIPADPAPTAAAHLDALLSAVNAERAALSLAPLDWDARLADAAADHAHGMAEADFFDHVGPDGRELRDRIADVARNEFPLTRQTLWRARNHPSWTPNAVAEAVVREWMASPGRRAALLDPALTHAGAAILRARFDGSAVMVFAGPAAI